MNFSLKDALEETDRVLETALADARSELALLDERRAELVALINTAEAMRRSGQAPGTGSGTMGKPLTLHEALAVVLHDHANRWMTVKELASEVNERHLYRKKDGSDVDPSQVHARTKNYEQLFEKNGPNVRMRTELAAPAEDVAT